MKVSTEQKVGLFFIVALVVLAGMIEMVQDWQPFEKQNPYHTFFTSAVGLKVGDPVRMAGVEVGKIKSITIDGMLVRVDFMVDEETAIRTDSTAMVRQMNLLGGQFLGLDFGDPQSEILPPDSEIRSAQSSNIDELVTSLDKNQQKLFNKMDQIVDKINNGDGLIGRLVNDDDIYDDLKQAISSLSKIASGLEERDIAKDLGETMANLNEVTTRLKNGEGTIGKLLTDEETYENIRSALADLSEIANKAKNGEGALGKLLTEDKLYDDFKAAMEHIRSITAKIDGGEGTIGKLVNDSDLYFDAKTTLNKVEKAADGINDSGAISALGTISGTLF
ncbi:MAG: MCE family protein [Desulfuromonas sp.]|nr:MAG: MCE family protein [Desulfuromonas sp.]